MMCGSACVDTMTSAANCGGCGRACNGTCTNGVCATTSGTGGAGGGTGGTGGTTTACTPLGAIPRRLWRLSVEQWGSAVKDLLGLTTAPILSNRGGEAAYAFFSDATLGVDQDFQFALYQSSQNDVLPAIASKITTLAPVYGDDRGGAADVRADVRARRRAPRRSAARSTRPRSPTSWRSTTRAS